MKTSSLISTFQTGYGSDVDYLGTGNINVVSSQLQIQALSGGANYSNITSIASYDLTSSYAFIELVSAGNQALVSFEIYPMFLQLDANNALFFLVSGNFIAAYKKIAGVSSIVGSGAAYVNATHRFVRIREENDVIYWDYSADRVTWVAFQNATVASLFAVTALKIRIECGVYANEVSTTQALFDNVNMKNAGQPPFFRKSRPRPFAPSRAR